MAKHYDAQAEADKVARKMCRDAYTRGHTVHFTLGRLVELMLGVKVIRAIYRGKPA